MTLKVEDLACDARDVGVEAKIFGSDGQEVTSSNLEANTGCYGGLVIESKSYDARVLGSWGRSGHVEFYLCRVDWINWDCGVYIGSTYYSIDD